MTDKKVQLDEDVEKGYISCRVSDGVTHAEIFQKNGEPLTGKSLQNIDDNTVQAEEDLVILLQAALTKAESPAGCNNYTETCINDDGTLKLGINSPLLGQELAISRLAQYSEKYEDELPLCTSVIGQARFYGHKIKIPDGVMF